MLPVQSAETSSGPTRMRLFGAESAYDINPCLHIVLESGPVGRLRTFAVIKRLVEKFEKDVAVGGELRCHKRPERVCFRDSVVSIITDIVPVDNRVNIFSFAVVDNRPEKIGVIIIGVGLIILGTTAETVFVLRVNRETYDFCVPARRTAAGIVFIRYPVNQIDYTAIPNLSSANINSIDAPQDDDVAVGVFNFVGVRVQPWSNGVKRRN